MIKINFAERHALGAGPDIIKEDATDITLKLQGITNQNKQEVKGLLEKIITNLPEKIHTFRLITNEMPSFMFTADDLVNLLKNLKSSVTALDLSYINWGGFFLPETKVKFLQNLPDTISTLIITNNKFYLRSLVIRNSSYVVESNPQNSILKIIYRDLALISLDEFKCIINKCFPKLLKFECSSNMYKKEIDELFSQRRENLKEIDKELIQRVQEPGIAKEILEYASLASAVEYLNTPGSSDITRAACSKIPS